MVFGEGERLKEVFGEGEQLNKVSGKQSKEDSRQAGTSAIVGKGRGWWWGEAAGSQPWGGDRGVTSSRRRRGMKD